MMMKTIGRHKRCQKAKQHEVRNDMLVNNVHLVNITYFLALSSYLINQIE